MFNRYKIFAIYLFAIPLAMLLGIMAASPNGLTFVLIGMLLLFLTLPLFIRWHHALLIVFWNSAFAAFFLPGQPTFWFLLAGLSFGLAVLNYVVGKKPFLSVPEMTWPLLFLAAVVMGTAFYRGGIGIQALGGAAHGGKNYVYLLFSIAGYFALTAVQIPISKSRRMTGLFFLSGMSYVLSNIAYALGPAFYFLYYIVPSGFALDQAANASGLGGSGRLQGLAPACSAILCFLLLFYGIRGLFDWTKPWRLVFLLVAIGASLFGGFRSMLALLFLILAFQFYFEGLVRTRLLPVIVGVAICGFVLLLFFADRMPLSAQRAVSFLPVNVDSGVRSDALGSSDWRFQMWAIVWEEVPQYLLIGKGYSIDPAAMDSTVQAIHMGMLPSFEESMLAGNYHSGPLSVIVPFGIMGSVAFLWVLFAGGRVLYSNYRYGNERLRLINSVLLSYYLAYIISFFFIFGALNSELSVFLGAIGLSVSLNGGVMRKSALERVRASEPQAYAIELR
jgi:hypothetical protein